MKEEDIKMELLKRHVQLWKYPYYGSRDSYIKIQELATSFAKDLNLINEQNIILQGINHFKDHAIEKLCIKGKILEELEIKILGNTQQLDNSNSISFQSCIAERVEIQQNSIKFHRVNPELNIGDFSQSLCAVLNVSDIRLVHKGKTLDANTCNNNGNGTRLSTTLLPLPKGRATLFCIVRNKPIQSDVKTDQELIESIRQAASELQSSSGLDITDSTGNHVSMSQTERVAFLTALGFHAIGQKRIEMEEYGPALVFLLEADNEWNHIPMTWRSKVDNYGQLQLEIGWVYLKLENMESLPDVLQRLEAAETVLRKQVHKNFVTLALVQADMGKPVPALAAIFVRLFLLQGVAYYFCQNNRTKSKECIDSAWALANSLRAVSTPESVTALMEAVGATQSEAISALRRSNGIVDQAADLVVKEISDSNKAAEQRRQQNKIGLCENGRDYVDMTLLDQMQSLLQGVGNERAIAGGLLRLSNNNIDGALAIYQECNRDESIVFQRLTNLDVQEGITSEELVARKRQRTTLGGGTKKVDEIALASLLSMNIDHSLARQSLLCNDNNVDEALLWLNQRSFNSVASISQGDDTNTCSHDCTTERNESRADGQPLTGNQPTTVSNINNTQSSLSASIPIVSEESRVAMQNLTRLMTEKENAQKKAIEMLQDTLEEALSGQQQGDGKFCLGSTLDEEWDYIQKYKAILDST